MFRVRVASYDAIQIGFTQTMLGFFLIPTPYCVGSGRGRRSCCEQQVSTWGKGIQRAKGGAQAEDSRTARLEEELEDSLSRADAAERRVAELERRALTRIV